MKLSATQKNTIDTLHRNGGRLVRLAGGFWTYDGCAMERDNVPEWWVSVGTVRVLERHGLLVRANEDHEEWRDARLLVRL